jgi:hypothetical protein
VATPDRLTITARLRELLDQHWRVVVKQGTAFMSPEERNIWYAISLVTVGVAMIGITNQTGLGELLTITGGLWILNLERERIRDAARKFLTIGEQSPTTIPTQSADAADLSILFWRLPNEMQSKRLEQALRAIGTHSAKFSTHENTDCSRLARDLSATFALADWKVSGPHVGIDDRLEATGILVRGKENLDLASKVAESIRLATNANCAAIVTLGPEESWDLVITIGPKGTVRSQLSPIQRAQC